MSFYVINKDLTKVKSKQLAPISFSISGNFLLEIPDNVSIENPTDPVITNPGGLIEKKIDGFKFLHTSLTNDVYDEFITSPNIDLNESNGVIVGPYKRTGFFPGGQLVTNQISFNALNTIFANWYGFTLTNLQSNSVPDKLLYNHNSSGTEYVPFNTNLFTVELRNSTNTGASLHTFSYQQEENLVLTADNYRLRFTNNSPDTTYFLSDWLLLHD